MAGLKPLARDWLPPALLRWLRRQRAVGIRFDGDFSSWEEVKARCEGYDDERILAKVLEATLKVKHGKAAFERDSVLFDQIEYVWPMLAGLMWGAARQGGRLDVLDFGGALGSSYFQHREFLASLSSVRWNVVEQGHYVDAAREQLQDAQLRFYPSIEECLVENQPNVVLLSSVLQYLEHPFEVLERLSQVGVDCLLIDRTPFVDEGAGRLVIQHVPESIYQASYPMWIFSKPDFLRVLEQSGWRVVASSACPEGDVHPERGGAFSFQGLLCEAIR